MFFESVFQKSSFSLSTYSFKVGQSPLQLTTRVLLLHTVVTVLQYSDQGTATTVWSKSVCTGYVIRTSPRCISYR